MITIKVCGQTWLKLLTNRLRSGSFDPCFPGLGKPFPKSKRGTGEQGICISCLFPDVLLGFNHFQSFDSSEVPLVERRQLTLAFERSGGDDQIVWADHCAGGFEMCPDASVIVGSLLGVRNDWKDFQQCPQVLLSSELISSCRPLNAMPKFGNSDCGDFECLVSL